MEKLQEDLTSLNARLESYEQAYLQGNKDGHILRSIKYYRDETKRVRSRLLGEAASATAEAPQG